MVFPHEQPGQTSLLNLPGNAPRTDLTSTGAHIEPTTTPPPQAGPARPLQLPASKVEPEISPAAGKYRTAGVVKVDPNAAQ